MKKLAKILLPIGISFLSLSSNAQNIERYLDDDITFDSVSERFYHYQDRDDLDTIAVDTLWGYFGEIPSQRIYLDINKNKVLDVVEFYALKKKIDSTNAEIDSTKTKPIYEMSSAPWKYFLAEDSEGKEKGDTVRFEVVFDYFIDKINGNEIYETKLEQLRKEKQEKKARELFYYFFSPDYWMRIYEPSKAKEI